MVRDEVVGVLDCQSNLPAFFDNETVDLLTLFATQASIGLQNAKLYSMLQRRAAQLEAINAIAKRTTVELDLKELLDRLCGQLPQSFQVEHVAVFLRDEDGDLILRAHQGTLTFALKLGDQLPNGYACSSGSGQRNPYCGDPSLCPAACCPSGREEVCLPLVSFGENIGLLICASTQEKAFHPNDIQALESVADILATATQNARYVDRVRQLAYRDGLTGVFNRRYFDSRLVDEVTRAARYGGGVSVLMIDLDHFKKINDEFGHMLGDDVLRAVSAIFVRQLRKVDVVCRYGGEEFAVVLPATQGASAAAVAEKLRCAVANAEYAGIPYPVTVSIGVAEFPVHGITRDDIIRAADAALYSAKEAGRNQICLASVSAASTGDGAISPGV
jgi:diguanylate cyclase (GGDEF)-like protein